MTDPYANIRRALEMGPASGPYKQSEFTPQRVDTRSGSINVAWYCNFDNGAREAEAEATAALIAACDPDTIRALVEERDALREDACVALVADIRFACGDNGTRMQPELVEFIRELAKDAERYRWLRDSQKVAGSGPEIRLWNRDEVTYGRELHAHGLDAAIDQARGRENGNG